MQKDTTSESDTQFQAPMTASDDDLGRVDCGPSQPKLASFPKGRKNRCFRAIWYESFRWLEYSVKQDRAFCFACRNFSTSTSKSDIAFMKTGWNAWAKATKTNRGLRKHDACSDHLLSMTRWESHASQREQEAAGIRKQLASGICWIQTGLQLLAITESIRRCYSIIINSFARKKWHTEDTTKQLNHRMLVNGRKLSI